MLIRPRPTPGARLRRFSQLARLHARPRKPSSPEPADHIEPGSAHHHDLPSFLAYAATTNLSPTSTVYRGTHYEYTVAASLARLGLALTRTGRAADRGIDLLGTWHVPAPPHPPPSTTTATTAPSTPLPPPLRVLVQCKNAARVSPEAVRGLEGAFAGAPARWRGRAGTLGLLASAVPATKGVREAVGRSTWPLAFAMVEPGEVGGLVRQLVWNRAAEATGLAGLGVTVRYLDEGRRSEVALTWNGWVLDPVEEPGRSDAGGENGGG
jgi:hypothetical protein